MLDGEAPPAVIEPEQEETVETVSIEGDALCQDILPLAAWVKEELERGDPEKCVPCGLGLIAGWYRDKVEGANMPELVAKIDTLGEGEHTNEEIARVLDEVKAEVTDEGTRKTLVGYDCMMQRQNIEEVPE